MAEDDLMYLLRRAAEERKLAGEAANIASRAAHRSLANAYAERARGSVEVPSSRGSDATPR